MIENNLSDIEKLLAISMIFELFKQGKISQEEFQKVCESHKKILSENNISFSSYFEEK